MPLNKSENIFIREKYDNARSALSKLSQEVEQLKGKQEKQLEDILQQKVNTWLHTADDVLNSLHPHPSSIHCASSLINVVMTVIC